MNLILHLRKHPLAAVLTALAAGLSLWMAFTPDDAYITFRYSQHLAEGMGPVYNSGEAVEGYTNFLWMLLMTLPHALGLPVEWAAALTGIFFYSLSLLRWHQIAMHTLGSPVTATMSLALTAGQFTLIAFAGSGMETALNLWLWTQVIFTFSQSPFPPMKSGLWMGLAVLCRPDAVVLWVAATLLLLIQRSGWKNMVIWFLPAITLTGIWALWKWNYYGAWLPNTFWIKASEGRWLQGLQYLGLYSACTLLPVSLLLVAWRRLGKRAPLPTIILLCSMLSILWMAYLLYIGGDFMEFRMMAPVIPAMVLAGMWAIEPLGKRATNLATLALLVIQFLYGLGFGNWYYTGFVIPVHRLADETANAGHGLVIQGKVLASLNGSNPVRIASGTAGALPYYSGLPCVDMLGLNDATIAGQAEIDQSIPGHTRFASIDYLHDRKVNLVLGRWEVLAREPLPDSLSFNHPQLMAMMGNWNVRDLQGNEKVVQFELANGEALRALYLLPHPEIERRIESGEWKASVVLPY